MEYLKGSENFSPSLRSHFRSPHLSRDHDQSCDNPTVTVAKRFCADFAPSPEADIAKFTAMETETKIILLKKTEKNTIGVFAQKSFEFDDVITECIGGIKEAIDNTTATRSVCRFLSDSVEPNCKFDRIILPDSGQARIVLRSVKNVECGEELTINKSKIQLIQ